MYQVDISAKLIRQTLTVSNVIGRCKVVAGLPPNVRLLGGLFIPRGDDDEEPGYISLYFDDPENPSTELQRIEILMTKEEDDAGAR